ncbi:MAG: hypothetical protein HND52_14485 [Ignavibacteriae bacterium]|nr:hypothetical protein [Ignavibacteriota bacterium]NOG99161.1 hypothetical protein [Ignavibacteriota bacterium]
MKKLKRNKDWQAYLLIEFILILISFIIPISPSKTGSGKGIASWFLNDPTYIEKVIVNFILLHLLVLIIFAGYFLWKLLGRN